MAPHLSILILNYKTKTATTRCLESIVKHYKTELESEKIEILVLDNGSDDNSFEELKKLEKKIPALSVFESRENLGFGNGLNYLSKKSRGKYLLFLNSDTVVEDSGINLMTSFMERHPEAGIVGAKLTLENGEIEPSIGKFYTLFNLFFMLLGLQRFGLVRYSSQKEKAVDWVSGGAMMTKKDLFEKVGGFDNHFFMYIEDMELCYRLKGQSSKVFYFPNITIIHSQHGSSDRQYAILNIYQGILYFYKKHYSYPEYLLAKTLLFAKAGILGLLGNKTYRRILKETV